MSLRKVLVYLQALRSGGLRFWHGLPGRHDTEKRQIGVGVSQACVWQRITWVFLESLAEILSRFLKVFRVPFIPVVASHQVEAIRAGVLGVALRQALLVISGQLQPQLLSNF